jgi:phosphoribosyl-ATP pyrophosphohydrolase
MSEGFEVEVEMPRADIDKLLKKYKKLKKYQKSSLFAVKTMDGTEEIISKLLEEAEENPL